MGQKDRKKEQMEVFNVSTPELTMARDMVL